MKRLFLLAVLFTSWLAVSADEPAAPAITRDSQIGTSSAEESFFQDPFAKEGETNSPPVKISDPLEKVNRALFKFNDRLYFWVLRPVGKAYGTIFPEPFRQSIKRAFINVRYPVRLVNNLLQAKFEQAGVETARFLVNSTVGIGGLFDPAGDEWDLTSYPEDLDQTLGFYRLPTGIYLNWPIFGPSSVRGTVGTIGDSFLSPLHYIGGWEVTLGTRGGDTVNSASLRLGEYESFIKSSFDPYVSLRDAYFENRRALVNQ